MNKILSHPWIQPLWTLQEMVLRPDAWILFDDGLLNVDQNQSSKDYDVPFKA